MQYQNGLKCIVHCDSRAALQWVQNISYDGFGTTWRCRANYDLEAAIKFCLLDLPIKIQWEWVRGHVSRWKQTHDFTWPEELNERADDVATDARQDCNIPNNRHWLEQLVSMLGSSGCISGNLSNAIRFCCTTLDLQSFWKERYHWTTAQLSLVDNTGTKAAASKLCAATARQIHKLWCGWLPVNSRESRIDPDWLPGCSACSTTGLVSETVDHIFQC